MLFEHILVLVRGGGDLASGVIYRLHQAGFLVVVTELARPKLVRRTASFGEAIYSKTTFIQNVCARHVTEIETLENVLSKREIPIFVDKGRHLISILRPTIVIDARMEKHPLDTLIDDAPLVIGLGPGYKAGEHCHVIIETNRGHNLGRVIKTGMAEPNTGVPSTVQGITENRVLRSPQNGFVSPYFSIGDQIKSGEMIAVVRGAPIMAKFNGVLRGLVHPSLPVTKGMKIGDLDPRAKQEHCFTISDKALAIGGGALEAILAAPQIRSILTAQSS